MNHKLYKYTKLKFYDINYINFLEQKSELADESKRNEHTKN